MRARAVVALLVTACAPLSRADAPPAATPGAPPLPAGATPVMLGGALATEMNEFGGALTPDGRELYLSISVPRSYAYAIVASRRDGARWGEPEVVAFSDVARNYDPVLSPDGRRLYFVSDRGVDGRLATPANPDLWMVERGAGGAWGAPRRLPAPINSDPVTGRLPEHFASEAADGTLYFAAERREHPGMELFVARRRPDGGYETPVPIGAPVDTPGLEAEPLVAPDQSFLLFAAYERAGGRGHFDLYVAHRRPDGGWGEPVSLGPAVNTAARDYSPRLAPDGRTLLFTSERHFALGRPAGARLTHAELAAGLRGPLNGNGNLYAVDLRALGALPPSR
ncbi:hypothetical protein [Roseisolibacter sp. H3M3-2]|uniref:TolB family protein n=1 Tax=Roseisolibacter sp. H3M3-2 TaxID=3031323 RepID=UPI0023DC860E|nr:hypothetical protein [Roseisolibacter sp. H3M3-2]MDF1505921.1 hypothetical protein [Roseisolibacter sp. H3M3-2]